MSWHTVGTDHIEQFKRSWPCHGLPDQLAKLACEFASNGDLVDLVASTAEGYTLDTRAFDGPALLALVQDCQAAPPQSL